MRINTAIRSTPERHFWRQKTSYLDGGICVAGNENVVLELHAGSERLMADERVDAVSIIRVPHADRRIQRTAYDVFPVELQTVHAICVTLLM